MIMIMNTANKTKMQQIATATIALLLIYKSDEENVVLLELLWFFTTFELFRLFLFQIASLTFK